MLDCNIASFPGISIRRRGEEERLVHTVVCMGLILNQLLHETKDDISNGLGFVMTFVDGAQSNLRVCSYVTRYPS